MIDRSNKLARIAYINVVMDRVKKDISGMSLKLRILSVTLCLPLGLILLSSFARAAPNNLEEKLELFRRPTGLTFPADNPYSESKYKLGKALFFDTRLSDNRTLSCASCHQPKKDWTDGRSKAIGRNHELQKRKTPTLLNLAWDDLYFWDGRSSSLEEQALVPFATSSELNLTEAQLVARLQEIKGYSALFKAAFPTDSHPVTATNIAKALATFERKIVSAKAPFDLWVEGDPKAVSLEAKKGFEIFVGRGHCLGCHSGWNFGDGTFHDIGVDDHDIGRAAIVDLPKLCHSFKTVGLRNIERRPPYMHNGSLKTLDEVIDLYNGKYVKRSSLDEVLKEIHLTQEDKKQLIAFLKTLTSSDAIIEPPVLP